MSNKIKASELKVGQVCKNKYAIYKIVKAYNPFLKKWGKIRAEVVKPLVEEFNVVSGPVYVIPHNNWVELVEEKE